MYAGIATRIVKTVIPYSMLYSWLLFICLVILSKALLTHHNHAMHNVFLSSELSAVSSSEDHEKSFHALEENLLNQVTKAVKIRERPGLPLNLACNNWVSAGYKGDIRCWNADKSIYW